MNRTSWQAIRDEARRRIHARDWRPGEMIPNEEDLAREFGCARATVNRAMRALAEDGLLDRRRKGGTRVTLHPVRRAVLEIAVVRQEIEAAGAVYGYRRLVQEMSPAPPALRRRGTALHLRALHLADGTPYALEDRWIDPNLPGLANAPFDRVSPNEWLLEHVPYTGGEIAFRADAAADAATDLGIAPDAPVLRLDRVTWDGPRVVTAVTLTYRPGHRLAAAL